MIVCPKCSYENLDDALYCNLCKEIFRKEKKETPVKDKITSIHDLPEEIRNLLLQQKAEIMGNGKEKLGINVQKVYLLFAIIGIGIFALILLLRFLSNYYAR